MKTIQDKIKDEFGKVHAKIIKHFSDGRSEINFIDYFTAGIEFAQRWIPIEEELPPIDEYVLIRYDGNSSFVREIDFVYIKKYGSNAFVKFVMVGLRYVSIKE